MGKSLDPSLENCSIIWSQGEGKKEEEKLNMVFRNQLVIMNKILSTQEFENLSVQFKCEKDPTTGQPIDLEFTTDRFTHVDEEDAGLFKVCAMQKIKSEPDPA